MKNGVITCSPRFTKKKNHYQLFQSPHSTMSSPQMFYKITQLRSTIGMPPVTKKNIAALGLKRINHTVYQKVSVATAHKLRRVKELVRLELLPEQEALAAKNAPRARPPPGFEQVGQL